MKSATPHRLVALADPLGRANGFLIPAFRGAGANALRVAESESGRISAFVPLEPIELETIEIDGGDHKIGDPLPWAFAFSEADVIVGFGMEGRATLAARMDDAFFIDRPMLALEVAQFLDDETSQAEFEGRSYNRLRRISSTQADAWRDYSILTPSFRKFLLGQKDWPQNAAVRFGKLVLSTKKKCAFIHGVDDTTRREIEPAIKKAVRSALKRHAKLLDHHKGWDIVLLTGSSSKKPDKSELTEDVGCMLYIHEWDDAEAVAREVGHVGEAVRIYGPAERQKFDDDRARISAPAFVLFRADEAPEGMSAGAGPLYGLEARARDSRQAHLFPSPPPASMQGVVELRPPRSLGFFERGKSIARELRMTLPPLLNLIQHMGMSLPSERTLMLRARGVGADAGSDAWAALYGRCWQEGIYDATGIALERVPAMLGGPMLPESARILFPEVDSLGNDESLLTLDRSKTDVLLLIDGTRRTGEPNWYAHGRAVEHILLHNGWRIPDPGDSHGRERSLHVQGALTSLDCLTRPQAVRGSSGWDHNDLLNRRFSDIRKFAVEEGVTPTVILDRLQASNTLTITMRELVRFPARTGSIWTLAAQILQRLQAPFPSHARSLIFALIANAALREGRSRHHRTKDLHTIISNAVWWRRVDLVCKSVRSREGETIAVMEMVPNPKMMDASEFVKFSMKFLLIINPDGVILEDVNE